MKIQITTVDGGTETYISSDYDFLDWATQDESTFILTESNGQKVVDKYPNRNVVCLEVLGDDELWNAMWNRFLK